MTQLSVNEDGKLEVNGELLIFFYPSGDVDTFTWGKKLNKQKLAAALFEAREMGYMPNEEEVLFPDGEVFHVDQNLGD